MNADRSGDQVDGSPAGERFSREFVNDARVVLPVIDAAILEPGYAVHRRRVLRLVSKEMARPVVRWESEVVLHLLDSGHLSLGGARHVDCDGSRLAVQPVLVPEVTKRAVAALRRALRESGQSGGDGDRPGVAD